MIFVVVNTEVWVTITDNVYTLLQEHLPYNICGSEYRSIGNTYRHSLNTEVWVTITDNICTLLQGHLPYDSCGIEYRSMGNNYRQCLYPATGTLTLR